MKKYIFPIMLIISANLYGQRIDVFADFPIPTNSFSGKISANIQCNLKLNKKKTYLGFGGSIAFLENRHNLQLTNFNLYIGYNKKWDISPSVYSIPYLKVGYSRFQFASLHNDGINTEIGVSVFHTSISPRLGFHLGYRQYVLGEFVFPTKNEKTSGTFGLLLLGLHYNYNL